MNNASKLEFVIRDWIDVHNVVRIPQKYYDIHDTTAIKTKIWTLCNKGTYEEGDCVSIPKLVCINDLNLSVNTINNFQLYAINNTEYYSSIYAALYRCVRSKFLIKCNIKDTIIYIGNGIILNDNLEVLFSVNLDCSVDSYYDLYQLDSVSIFVNPKVYLGTSNIDKFIVKYLVPLLSKIIVTNDSASKLNYTSELKDSCVLETFYNKYDPLANTDEGIELLHKNLPILINTLYGTNMCRFTAPPPRVPNVLDSNDLDIVYSYYAREYTIISKRYGIMYKDGVYYNLDFNKINITYKNEIIQIESFDEASPEQLANIETSFI